MSLFARLVGTERPDVAFLHGLFGQGKNWTAIAQGLLPEHSSVLLDLPNHGNSPWTDSFSYTDMADMVAEELDTKLGSAARINLVGHSMGGKVAMLVALRHPTLVRSLVVVDIAPDASSHGYWFDSIVKALWSIDLASLHHRRDADAQLATSIPDPAVRQFLLQNLRQSHSRSWAWQMNLPVLAAALPMISGWTDPGHRQYKGPVLWLRGENSEYVSTEHIEPMRRLFPQARLVTVPGAGHWVHADEPAFVIAALRDFLATER